MSETRTKFWNDWVDMYKGHQRLGQFFVNRFNPSQNELKSVDCENMFYETDTVKTKAAINKLLDMWCG